MEIFTGAEKLVLKGLGPSMSHCDPLQITCRESMESMEDMELITVYFQQKELTMLLHPPRVLSCLTSQIGFTCE